MFRQQYPGEDGKGRVLPHCFDGFAQGVADVGMGEDGAALVRHQGKEVAAALLVVSSVVHGEKGCGEMRDIFAVGHEWPTYTGFICRRSGLLEMERRSGILPDVFCCRP